MKVESENVVININLENYISKDFILELLNESMPLYIKNFLKKEDIPYRFSTDADFEDIEDEEELNLLKNETFALFVTDIEDDGDNFSSVEFEILLNYETMVNIEIEKDLFENYYESNLELLVPNVIITNIITSFYHEVGHAVDFFILEDKQILADSENNLFLDSYAKRDDLFDELLKSEKDFMYDYLEERNYLDEDKEEYFAEYYGLYMTCLLFSQTKEMLDFYLNENLFNYFGTINEKIIHTYS